MALEYTGEIVCEVNGKEVDIVSLDETVVTGRKMVKTMNRTGRAKGFAKGISTVELKITAPAPLAGDFDWAGMENAKIDIYPQGGGGVRTTYSDCSSASVGSRYQLEGEMVRDISIFALRKA